MSHGKETPRQKMIGMMYLFLTAMLAINVSSEVLDAFSIVDKGLGNTIKTFENKNANIYDIINRAYDENPQKAGKAKLVVDQLAPKSKSLVDFIQALKQELVVTADGPEGRVDSIVSKDNLDISAQIMILGKKGKLLKDQLLDYKKFLISNVDPTHTGVIKTVNSTINTENPPLGRDGIQHSWESIQFSHIPLIGAVTLLTKIQSDVRNAESDMLNYVHGSIEAKSYKFNKLTAEVISESDYILKGQSYTAKVFLAATDTTVTPNIVVGNSKLRTESGKGIYSVNTSSVGVKTWAGVIKYKLPTGEIKQFAFKKSYIVAEPNVVVSATKMNVLYVGVDNPISVSAPGISSDKISATMTNGKLIKRGDSYIAKPLIAHKPAMIRVIATINGKSQEMAVIKFRVKSIPDPVAVIANKKGGLIMKNLLLASPYLIAKMENFDFDLKFKITKFTLSVVDKGGYTREEVSTSARFTSQQLAIIKNMRRGQKLYFEDIKAVGPDKSIRNLSTISFKLK